MAKKKNGGSGSVFDVLFEPIDSAWIAVMRIVFGLVLCYEIYTYVKYDYNKAMYSFSVPFPLQYYGFQWIPSMSPKYVPMLVNTLCLLAFFVTIGFFYHFSMFLFVIGFTYIQVYEQSTYLNHIYLTIVLCFTVLFLPCNCRASVDSYIFPSVYSRTVPRWTKLTMWMIMFVVYFDASFAKINNDWLRGEPLRHWLPKRKSRLGWLLAQESFAYVMSYGGIVYDALAAPLLMHPKTRVFGLIFNFMFHLSNYTIFNIGIFPWLCMSLNIIYIDSDTYIRPILDRFSSAVPEKKEEKEQKTKKGHAGMTWKRYIIVTVLILYTLYHVLFPLRFVLYPGDVAWTEYGHLFSWRMKLRDKNCVVMSTRFRDVEDNKTREFQLASLYNPQQVEYIISRPDMISQAAFNIKSLLEKQNEGRHFEILFDIQCQLNFRPLKPYTNPNIDITSHPTYDWPYPWLEPAPGINEDMLSEYPWNFKWTFSWFTTFPECSLADKNEVMEIEKKRREKMLKEQKNQKNVKNDPKK